MNCALQGDSLLYGNVLFRVIYDGLGQFFPQWLCWLDFFIAGFAIMFILVNGILLGSAFYTWAERRILGRFHNRVGPNRWGPFGLLQPIADLVKLIAKEDIVPSVADRIVFTAVPILMVMPLILVLAVVPFAKNTYLADLNVAVLYIVAVPAITTLAIFMAGWGSGNRFATFGAMRGVAMLISYEVPTILALAGVVLIAGSMSMTAIINAQAIPFLLVQPLGALLFLVGISAEINRTPFDVVEAESELVGGYHTEFSGVRFALIGLAEFGAVLTASAIMATLFLGGWSGPFLSGQLGALWFLLKVAFFAFIFIWIRASFPRLRIDQIMAFAWKFMFPMALLNLVVTAVEVYIFKDDTTGAISTGELWAMAGINLTIGVIAVLLAGHIIKESIRPPRVTMAAPLTPVSSMTWTEPQSGGVTQEVG